MNPSCLLRVIYISEHRGHPANAQRAHFQSVTHVPWTRFSFASWHFSANNPRDIEWFFLLLLVMKSYILSLHQLHLVSTNLHICIYTDGCSMDVVPGAISAKWRGNITPLIYHSVKSSHVQWPMSEVHTCDGWGVTGDTFSVICDIAVSHVRTCDMDHSTCDNCSWVIFISSSWIEISETCVLWLIIRLATWHSVPDIVSGFRGAREGSG